MDDPWGNAWGDPPETKSIENNVKDHGWRVTASVDLGMPSWAKAVPRWEPEPTQDASIWQPAGLDVPAELDVGWGSSTLEGVEDELDLATPLAEAGPAPDDPLQIADPPVLEIVEEELPRAPTPVISHPRSSPARLHDVDTTSFDAVPSNSSAEWISPPLVAEDDAWGSPWGAVPPSSVESVSKTPEPPLDEWEKAVVHKKIRDTRLVRLQLVMRSLVRWLIIVIYLLASRSDGKDTGSIR